MAMPPRIGVLAVQGDFREHAAILRGLGADVVEVRKPVLLRHGRVLAASFHPELTGDTRVHEVFLRLLEEAASVRT
jgi:glutamine amidotransferase PdxT